MAAIHEVRTLLQSKIENLGFTVLVDTDDRDPASPDECPAVMIRENGAELVFIEGQAGGTILHRAAFDLTFCQRALGDNEARSNAYELFSTVLCALLADFTLNGKVQEVRPVSYGGTQPVGQDVEGIDLDLQIDFCTSITDFDTLI